ncbi:ABC transporter substrate-binding protein [Roseivirga sp. BDSF3-8]|uniref:ABC transporter substrate-binding protein n=1 Tax=Roseivirga sp. BDSF3-8 TaxID=3241598 RepID=UPI003531BC25
MNKAFSILILVITLTAGTVLSPVNAQDYRNKFLNGKALYKEGRYGLAMEALRPVTTNEPDNIYHEYASFYYALSAYNDGQLDLAENMLMQIRQRSPRWSKTDEVRYWLSLVNFEQNDYRKAVGITKDIKSRDLQKETVNMKLHFLRQLNDTDELKALLSEYTYDREVAVVLAEKISAKSVMNQDKALLDFLVNEFDLNEEEFSVTREIRRVKKPYYRVAAVLPFFMDQLEENSSRVRNQFVLDLYTGMEVAVEELKEEGIDIRLFAYDTRRDSLATAKLMAMPEMATMDLIVGPLFPDPFKVVSDFSYRNRINMLNPLSTNSDIVSDNPYSFLFLPSQETQGRKAAEFAGAQFENKRALVFYEDNERDSVRAATYAKEITDNGFTVLRFIKISEGDERGTFGILKDYAGKDRNTEAIGHVFISGSSTLTAASAISALERLSQGIPAVVPGEWLDLSFINFEQAESLGLYFVDPDYTLYSAGVTETFKQKYIDKTSSLPNRFAYLGYESMMTTGQMLNKYGVYFQTGFEETDRQEGRLMSGVSYKEFNDNQIVPIIRFEEAELKIVNN